MVQWAKIEVKRRKGKVEGITKCDRKILKHNQDKGEKHSCKEISGWIEKKTKMKEKAVIKANRKKNRSLTYMKKKKKNIHTHKDTKENTDLKGGVSKTVRDG